MEDGHSICTMIAVHIHYHCQPVARIGKGTGNSEKCLVSKANIELEIRAFLINQRQAKCSLIGSVSP